MSITVVSTPPAPTQTTATDSGSDVTTQDFANLLQGQLAAAQPVVSGEALAGLPNTGTTPAEAVTADAALAAPADAASLLASLGLATIPAEVKSTDAAPTDKKPDETTPDDAVPSDAVPSDTAASMQAALGLVPTPAVASAQNPGKSEQQSGEPLTAVSGGAGQNSRVQGEPQSLNTAAGLSEKAPAGDQAAKFAATLATAEEAISAKTDSVATSDNVSPVTSNVAPPPAAPALHRDSSLAVNTPVRDQNWATDLGQKVVWLANADKQSAQLTLNPPEMGPIEISLDVDKGTASVSFTSANAEVRDALETALPRLREMFASAGIELGQTNVGAQSFSQQQAGYGEQNQSSSRAMSDNAILGTETIGTLQTGVLAARQGNGMVDLFA